MSDANSNGILALCRACAATVVALFTAVSVQAQTFINPGTTTVLDVTLSSEDCFTYPDQELAIGPKRTCLADADAATTQPIEVLAASGISSDPDTFFGQEVLAIGTLYQTIQIPLPGAEELHSPVLPVQIGTEVSWSGGMIVAGLDSTFAQVVATLQIRDITDATGSDLGPVVASNTFLFERTDADFEITIPDGTITAIADFLNLIEIVDISNRSGADVTALLVRGRTYAIELEARCDVQVPIFGFASCLFSSSALTTLGITPSDLFTPIDDDGFRVTDFTVTVGSDPVQDLLGTGGN